jgi:hypothetical protein
MVPPASDPTASTQVKAARFQELVTNAHDPDDGGTAGKESSDSKPTSTQVKTAPSLFCATTGQGQGIAPGFGDGDGWNEASRFHGYQVRASQAGPIRPRASGARTRRRGIWRCRNEAFRFQGLQVRASQAGSTRPRARDARTRRRSQCRSEVSAKAHLVLRACTVSSESSLSSATTREEEGESRSTQERPPTGKKLVLGNT